MALEKQIVPISLRGGVETKTDPKQVVPGKLLVAENIQFSTPGEYRKRDGFASFPKIIAGTPTTITTGQALAVYRNELLLADTTSLYSYDAANKQFVSKGAFQSVNVTTSNVIRDSHNQTQQDESTHAATGLALAAWEDSSGGSRYCVIDTATGQTLKASTLISANAAKPKVLVVANTFVLLWYDLSAHVIYAAILPARTPLATLVPVALTGTNGDANAVNSTTPAYDATVITNAGTNLYLVFGNAAGGGSLWMFTGAIVSAVTYKATWTDPTTVATVFGDLSSQGPVVGYYNGTALHYRSYSPTLATVLGSAGLETVANVSAITGVSTSASAVAVRFFYSIRNGIHSNYLVRTVALDGTQYSGAGAGYVVLGIPFGVSPTVSTPVVLLRSVGLAAKAFAYSSTAYVPVAFETTLQSTYFVADQNGNLVAKILSGNGGGVALRSLVTMLPETTAITASKFRLAVQAKDLLTTLPSSTSTSSAAQTIVYTQRGVSAATLDFFNPQESYLRAELGQNLHVGGGFLQMYDGLAPVEHGFHVYPEDLAVSVNPAGGNLAAGDYYYAVTYEWIDNEGQTHRSSPSIPLLVTTGGATSTVTLTIPTLRLTAKRNTRAPVSIMVYRTLVNQTTFFACVLSIVPDVSGSTGVPIINDTTVDTVTFVDRADDATITGNPPIYTTGGVLENIAPNALSSLTVYQNRIVGLDSSNPLVLWVSKQVVAGAPVEFSDFLTLNVDPQGGDATAVVGMDDKLIIFKESRIYYMTGQGPDSTGAQSDFQGPNLVTSDCGCINPRAIATTPGGVMFDSRKGKYLLGRDLSVSYVGADVEDFNGETVTSARLLPTKNEVRFTLGNGTALVYNYYPPTRAWSVSTNIAAVDSVIFDDLHTYLRADGTVLQETPGVFSDDGSFIGLKMVTSWLKFAGLQGFQRVYKALVLGEYLSPHQLVIGVAYDFNPTVDEEYTITPAPVSPFGGDPTYGSASPFGGDFPEYCWRVFPANQKCQAIQLTIADAQQGDPGESMSLSALTFEVGLMPGAVRRAAAKSV